MNLNDKELSTFIGSKIKEFRKKQKMTQKELALKIKKSDNTISNYETGIIAPSQDALFALAEALNVKVDNFFPARENENNLHRTLEHSENTFNFTDIKIMKELMDYLETLDEVEKTRLLSHLELTVEIFKKNIK